MAQRVTGNWSCCASLHAIDTGGVTTRGPSSYVMRDVVIDSFKGEAGEAALAAHLHLNS